MEKDGVWSMEGRQFMKGDKRYPKGFLTVFTVCFMAAGLSISVKAADDFYYSSSSSNAKTGYHYESVEIHKHTDSDAGYVECNGSGLNPSKEYLKKKLNIKGLDMSSEVVKATPTGTENGKVAPRALRVKGKGNSAALGTFDVACPYVCTDGYAGYAYFRYSYSYCKKLKEWYAVGANHKWLGCAKGDVGIQEDYSFAYSHNVYKYVLNTYTVRFNGNGATSGSMADQSMTYGKTASLSANTFARKGYIFAGWSKKPNGKLAYQNGESVSSLTSQHGGIVELYAKWKPITYRVSYLGNGADGGGMADQQITYDKTTALTPNGYTKTGHTFLYWDGQDGKIYENGQNIRNLADTQGAVFTMSARWRPNTYTIRFDGNGATSGSMEDQPMTYGVGKKLKKNQYVRAGYDFKGWNLKADASGRGFEDEKSVENLTTQDKAVVTLYAVWEPHIYVAYIGNEQTQGGNFIDYGDKGEGYSQSGSYTFDDNQEAEKEHFKKEVVVDAYTDDETGEKVKQKLEGTVVAWSSYSNTESMAPFDERKNKLGSKVSVKRVMEGGNVTVDRPCEDYFKNTELVSQGGNLLGASVKTTDVLIRGEAKPIRGLLYANRYAVWDMGAIIEAYDRYYTMEEAESGMITEEELLRHATATDKELKGKTDEKGTMAKGEDKKHNTSFTVCDFQEEDFKGHNHSAEISVTYRAVDSVGNVTDKMVIIHIVKSSDAPTEADPGEIRFISKQYLDTLKEDSIWVHNTEYKKELEDTLNYRRINPKQSDPVVLFGKNYSVDIPGTGEWNQKPQSVWTFTRTETEQIKQFIEENGPANFEREDGLKKFLETFRKNRK